jgi:hypothetical protein
MSAQRNGCEATADFAGTTMVCHLGPGHRSEHQDLVDWIGWKVIARPLECNGLASCLCPDCRAGNGYSVKLESE